MKNIKPQILTINEEWKNLEMVGFMKGNDNIAWLKAYFKRLKADFLFFPEFLNNE